MRGPVSAMLIAVACGLALPTVVGAVPADGHSEARVTPIGPDAPASAQHVSVRRASTDLEVASTLPEVADTISTLGLGRGFAGQVTDEGAAMTTVYWHGELPQDVRGYLTVAEKLGIEVRVVPDSRFELTTLREATGRVTGDEDLVQRAGISMASANVDGSGIKIWLSVEPHADVKEQIATTAELPADAISYRTGIGHIVPLAAHARY